MEGSCLDMKSSRWLRRCVTRDEHRCSSPLATWPSCWSLPPPVFFYLQLLMSCSCSSHLRSCMDSIWPCVTWLCFLPQLGKMRLTVPCRAVTCSHLQCFDAALYLQMNEKKPTWICPVCDKKAAYESLIIDGWVKPPQQFRHHLNQGWAVI